MLKTNIGMSTICMWDKHEFTSNPVMCPLQYKPTQIVRKKKEYYMNQNISLNSTIKTEDLTIIKQKTLYDDCFCSDKCCLAYIEANKRDPKYLKSKYIFLNEVKNGFNLVQANDWRILEKFGGFMSITEFRETNKIFELTDFYYDEHDKCVYVFKEKLTIN